MAGSHWLMKSEPESYSWSQLEAEGTGVWDGVRNYQARNNMRLMVEGDLALFYHSGKSREVVGVMEVVKTAYPDPTTDDDRWIAVDVRALRTLKRTVSLKAIRETDELQDMPLIRNSRLSVMPLSDVEYRRVLELAES